MAAEHRVVFGLCRTLYKRFLHVLFRVTPSDNLRKFRLRNSSMFLSPAPHCVSSAWHCILTNSPTAAAHLFSKFRPCPVLPGWRVGKPGHSPAQFLNNSCCVRRAARDQVVRLGALAVPFRTGGSSGCCPCAVEPQGRLRQDRKANSPPNTTKNTKAT